MDPRVPPILRDSLLRYAGHLERLFPGGVGGVYLHGSLALDAFDSDRSDIDFVTVLDREIARDDIRALKRLHRRMRAEDPWGSRLDGVYVPRSLLAPERTETGTQTVRTLIPGTDISKTKTMGARLESMDRICADTAMRKKAASARECQGLYFHHGRYRSRDAITAVATSVLHDRGIVIAGAEPASVFAPVPRSALDDEMRFNLEVYWNRKAARPYLFLFTEMVDFAVTTLARILHTLETGEIVSKPRAVSHLCELLPRWRGLIDDVRPPADVPPGGRRRLGRITRARLAVKFVGVTIDHAAASYGPGHSHRPHA